MKRSRSPIPGNKHCEILEFDGDMTAEFIREDWLKIDGAQQGDMRDNPRFLRARNRYLKAIRAVALPV